MQSGFQNTVIVFLALVSVPAPALALSCVEPDIANSYKYWDSAKEEYVIARGVLKPKGKLPKPTQLDNRPLDQKNLKAVPYQFTGVLIGASKNHKIKTSVQVQPSCLAHWCGGYPRDAQEAIFAFQRNSGKYKLITSPCGGQVFYGALDHTERKVRQCMKNGPCKPGLPLQQ